MRPLLDGILTANLIFTTLIFYVAARIYLLPKVQELKAQTILLPILLLHSLRHLGLMFLTQGATYPGMPPQFAYPAAIGDFITAVLAFTAIPAVMKNLPAARIQVWFFNLVGTLDLIMAITLATIFQAPACMGAAYWIPAFWVPALLVTHYVTFIVLTKHRMIGT
ncbi:MAG TPA: hypothetical protein VIU41_11775 [Geobacteraceae bacterium]